MANKTPDLCAFQNGKNELLLRELTSRRLFQFQNSNLGGKKKRKKESHFLGSSTLKFVQNEKMAFAEFL